MDYPLSATIFDLFVKCGREFLNAFFCYYSGGWSEERFAKAKLKD
jgi:hypothetical protein